MEKKLSKFSDELIRIMPQIIRGMFRKQTDPLVAGEISVPQYLTLDLIAAHSSLKMNDISKALNRTLPATSGLINRLYKMGLVKRIYDKMDRRVIHIILTPKGKALLKRLKAARIKAIKSIFSQLNARERKIYLAILKKIAAGLKARKK